MADASTMAALGWPRFRGALRLDWVCVTGRSVSQRSTACPVREVPCSDNSRGDRVQGVGRSILFYGGLERGDVASR